MSSGHAKKTDFRDEVINLRASRRQKTLIDKAAHILGRSRSDFILDIICREAEAVLLDRRLYLLSEDDFKTFSELLDSSTINSPKIRSLLELKTPWE